MFFILIHESSMKKQLTILLFYTDCIMATIPVCPGGGLCPGGGQSKTQSPHPSIQVLRKANLNVGPEGSDWILNPCCGLTFPNASGFAISFTCTA